MYLFTVEQVDAYDCIEVPTDSNLVSSAYENLTAACNATAQLYDVHHFVVVGVARPVVQKCLQMAVLIDVVGPFWILHKTRTEKPIIRYQVSFKIS